MRSRSIRKSRWSGSDGKRQAHYCSRERVESEVPREAKDEESRNCHCRIPAQRAAQTDEGRYVYGE